MKAFHRAAALRMIANSLVIVAVLVLASAAKGDEDPQPPASKPVVVDVVEAVEVVDWVEQAAVNQDPEALKNGVIEGLRPVVELELGFLFRVCEPSDEQKQQLKKMAEEKLQGMTDMLAGNQNAGIVFGIGIGGRANEVVANLQNGHSLSANPYSRVEKDISGAAREVLSKEQLAQYRKECELRERFNREAAVSGVVQLLDRNLTLTDEQRQSLTTRLIDRWEGALNVSLDSYTYNPQYVPALPAYVVVSELDENQRVIWNTLNQVNFPLQLGHMNLGIGWNE